MGHKQTCDSRQSTGVTFLWADLFLRIMQNMFHLSFIRSSRFHNTHGYTHILHKPPYPRLTLGWHHIFFLKASLTIVQDQLSIQKECIEMFVQTNGLQPPRDTDRILTFVSQRFVLMIPFYLQINVAAWSLRTKKKKKTILLVIKK